MNLKPFTTRKLGYQLLHYLPYAFLATWVICLGTNFENTLNLAAQGRIDFSTAWTYRFRGTEFESGRVTWNFVFPPWLWIVKLSGARLFWTTVVILVPVLLPRKSVLWRVSCLIAATCGAICSEGILLWIFTILLSRNAIVFLRQRHLWPGLVMGISALAMLAITLRWMNPAAYVQRQNVLGGKSLLDTIGLRMPAAKIQVQENCVAAVNPDDLRGVNSVEELDRTSLARFGQIVLVDLKIVEENYRLLLLRDEKNKPLFSDAARAFAAAEAGYAQKLMPDLVAAKDLCLIANFDTPPQIETSPFSRARKIIEARRKIGLDTKIIQLPAGPSSR